MLSVFKHFWKKRIAKHWLRNESCYPIKRSLWLKLFICRVFEDLSARIKDLKSTCNWSNHDKQVYQDSFEYNLAIFLSQLSKCIEIMIHDFCRSNGKQKVFFQTCLKAKGLNFFDESFSQIRPWKNFTTATRSNYFLVLSVAVMFVQI